MMEALTVKHVPASRACQVPDYAWFDSSATIEENGMNSRGAWTHAFSYPADPEPAIRRHLARRCRLCPRRPGRPGRRAAEPGRLRRVDNKVQSGALGVST